MAGLTLSAQDLDQHMESAGYARISLVWRGYRKAPTLLGNKIYMGSRPLG